MIVVGLSSAYFHATLSLIGQLLDEVAILWVCCAAFSMFYPKKFYPRWLNGNRYYTHSLHPQSVFINISCFSISAKRSARYWAFVRLYALHWPSGIRLSMHLPWCFWWSQHSDYFISSWESKRKSIHHSFRRSLIVPFHFSVNSHSESSVWAYEAHSYWDWPSFAGWWIDSVVTLGGEPISPICTPYGTSWYSFHRIRHASYLHTMRWRRNTSTVCRIYDIGPSIISNWEFHLSQSNATTQQPRITIFKIMLVQLNLLENIWTK